MGLNESFNRTLFSDDTTKDVLENHYGYFMACVIFCSCMSLPTIIGNGFVIYATHITKHSDPLDTLVPNISGDLINAIQSLAVVDMLFGLQTIPAHLLGNYVFSYFEIPNIIKFSIISQFKLLK